MSETIQEVVTQTEELKDIECPDKVILNAVPENKREEVKEALMVMRSEMYSGPIPPPEALARYEEIQPGAADRILKMAEKQIYTVKLKPNQKLSDFISELLGAF